MYFLFSCTCTYSVYLFIIDSYIVASRHGEKDGDVAVSETSAVGSEESMLLVV